MKIEINTKLKTLKVKGDVSIGRLFEIVHEHNLDGYTLVGHLMGESNFRGYIGQRPRPSRVPTFPHPGDVYSEYGPFNSEEPFTPLGPGLPRPLPGTVSPVMNLIKVIDEEE